MPDEKTRKAMLHATWKVPEFVLAYNQGVEDLVQLLFALIEKEETKDIRSVLEELKEKLQNRAKKAKRFSDLTRMTADEKPRS